MAIRVLYGSPAGSPLVAVAGDPFNVSENNPATVIVTGLAAAETVDLQITPDAGATWVNVDVDGTQVQFVGSPSEVTKTITSPGTYRLNKPLEAAAVVSGYIATSLDP